MVLHHVAQRPDRVVVGGPLFDTDRLGRRDLHVVDVPPVPDRLEHSVAEPEDHQILDGLLPEVVVDPEHLVLVEVLVKQRVQLTGGREITAERLLDDDAAPGSRCCLVAESSLAETLDHRAVCIRRDRQIEKDAGISIHRLDAFTQPLVDGRIVQLSVDVMQPLGQRIRHVVPRIVHLPEVAQALAEVLAKTLVVERASCHADNGKPRRKPLPSRESIQRGQELAACQVAGSAEDHHRRRAGRWLDPQAVPQRVVVHRWTNSNGE